ncbi:MAG: NUDIX domain-containing protein [Ilumatobacter sp.]|uniref:NUDIX hydrolase n=1 Tax=Ilumatobacter sp. TaxID=1967498 RepID=UPI0032996B28
MTTSHDPTDEARFLDEYDPEVFDRLSVAVDVALLTIVDDRLAVVVLERGEHPDRGRWQLPGGFVAIDESLDGTAARVLRNKAGIVDVYTEQLYTFGAVDRDPRTRVVAVSYYALVHPDALRLRPGVRLAEVTVPWSGEAGGSVALVLDGTELEMAFDHADIVGLVVRRLRGKLAYTPIGFELLPADFTLLELQRVHETILGRSVNKDSFRRTMLASGQLEPTGERQADVGHRPAALYRRVP